MDKDLRPDMKTFVMGLYGTNCYILTCPLSGDTAVIDPADYSTELDREIRARKVTKILITHGHYDHIQGLSRVREITGAPVHVHPLDAGSLGIRSKAELSDEDIVSLGGCGLRVLFTPGHTGGSICLYTEGLLFAGDTIFPGGPGKTANPAAFRAILKSIEDRILVLPPDTVIYPGHGEATTVAESRREYDIFRRRSHGKGMCGDVVWDSTS